MKPLIIVADRHIWQADAAFCTLPGYAVQLRVMEQGAITADCVADADILLVRSSTKVNAALLEGSRVRFVATATVGDDHIDLDYLQQRGVSFASAAGSSTDSVVEYLTAVLTSLHCEHGIALSQSRLGVIGVGRIGSKVAARAEALGMQVMRNDPPLEAADETAPWDSLDALLQQADVLTLHTPLVRDGIYCTQHLLDTAALDRFQGRVIINAARGGVVDNVALFNWLNGDSHRLAVLDCWEGEPCINRDLLSHSQLIVATPHIAGHSLDGKAANTQYVYDALCQFLGVDGGWHMNGVLFDVAPKRWPCLDKKDLWPQLLAMIHALYPLDDDITACKGLHALPKADAFASAFTHYRRHYPVRRDWQRSPFMLEPYSVELAALATSAGLVVCRSS